MPSTTYLMIGALVTCTLGLAQTANPSLARQFIAEGIHFIQQDQLAAAADRFRKALQADPNNADAANDLGIVLRRQRNFGEAVTAFESALRLRPGEARIHSNLALALQDMGRIADAIAAMKKAQSLDPDNITIRRNLGRTRTAARRGASAGIGRISSRPGNCIVAAKPAT
jgi:Flp pilus assembly protein TadD